MTEVRLRQSANRRRLFPRDRRDVVAQEEENRRISAAAITPLAIARQRQCNVAQQSRLAATGRADDGERQRIVTLASLDAQEIPDREIACELAPGHDVNIRAARIAGRGDA